MKVEGSHIHDLKGRSIEVSCEKYLKSIRRKKKLDLQSIGSQQNNNLLDLLFCQCKARKKCREVKKIYSNCHRSIMGTGSFDGRKHCGDELEKLYECAI